MNTHVPPYDPNDPRFTRDLLGDSVNVSSGCDTGEMPNEAEAKDLHEDSADVASREILMVAHLLAQGYKAELSQQLEVVSESPQRVEGSSPFTDFSSELKKPSSWGGFWLRMAAAISLLGLPTALLVHQVRQNQSLPENLASTTDALPSSPPLREQVREQVAPPVVEQVLVQPSTQNSDLLRVQKSQQQESPLFPMPVVAAAPNLQSPVDQGLEPPAAMKREVMMEESDGKSAASAKPRHKASRMMAPAPPQEAMEDAVSEPAVALSQTYQLPCFWNPEWTLHIRSKALDDEFEIQDSILTEQSLRDVSTMTWDSVNLKQRFSLSVSSRDERENALSSASKTKEVPLEVRKEVIRFLRQSLLENKAPDGLTWESLHAFAIESLKGDESPETQQLLKEISSAKDLRDTTKP